MSSTPKPFGVTGGPAPSAEALAPPRADFSLPRHLMQTPEDVMAAYARTAREARSQPLQVRFEESTLMSGGDSTVEDHPFDDEEQLEEPLEVDEGDSPSLTGPPTAPPPPSVASVASTRTVGQWETSSQ